MRNISDILMKLISVLFFYNSNEFKLLSAQLCNIQYAQNFRKQVSSRIIYFSEVTNIFFLLTTSVYVQMTDYPLYAKPLK